MASTWGTSWGTSWATSWDRVPSVLPPAALAEMYGGGAYKRRKKKEEDEPTIEEMVFELSKSPEDKKVVVKVLPKKWQEDFPSPQLTLVSDLVKRFESSTRSVQEKLARVYQARIVEQERMFLAERVRLEEEDEEEALFLLM